MDTKVNTKLSLCMIVCDETEFLAQCLNSVKDIVDEMVIVDTGSVDNTKEIATQLGARVFDYKWVDDFSQARNFSLEQATGDWILVLDADETISKSDHHRLLSLIGGTKADAYSLVQRTYGDDLKHTDYVSRGVDTYTESQDYAGWIPSNLVRLFRNKPDYRFRYRIHEVIEPSIEESGGLIYSDKIPLHHFTYEKSSDFVSNKHNRYLEYGLKQIKSTPKVPKPYIEVALVYCSRKDFNKAEEVLLKGNANVPNSTDIYDALGTLYIDTNRAVKAEPFIRKCLSLRPNDVILLNKLASVCMARQAFDEAESLLKRARKLAPDSLMVYNNMGLLYAVSNRHMKAVKAFQQSLRLNPVNLYALTSIGMLYVNLGHFKKAFPVLEKALKVGPDDVRVLYHLGVVCASLKQKPRAIELLKRAQHLQPGDTAITEKIREFS